MGRGTHSFIIRTLILTIFLELCLWPLLPGSRGGQTPAVDLSGAPVDPLKAVGGKVVVLIFVRTDCPISNRYAPTIQRLSAQHAGKAAFWLVYPDKAESAEAIRKHERDFHYELPALRDRRHTLVKESLAQITPEAAVFDATHRLVYHGRIDNLYEDFGRARAARLRTNSTTPFVRPSTAKCCQPITHRRLGVTFRT